MAAFFKRRGKKRKADQVIDMAMAQKKIDVGDFVVASHIVAKDAQSRSGIENKSTITACDLNTGRVSAIANGIRSRAWNTSAGAPNPYGHRRVWHQNRSKMQFENCMGSGSLPTRTPRVSTKNGLPDLR